MEEPRITALTVNDFKELLGGSPFDIHVKHQDDVRLNRLPVLISTNTDLSYYCSDADGQAIKKRIKQYVFGVEVGTALLNHPPCRLCTCHFASWFNRVDYF